MSDFIEFQTSTRQRYPLLLARLLLSSRPRRGKGRLLSSSRPRRGRGTFREYFRRAGSRSSLLARVRRSRIAPFLSARFSRSRGAVPGAWLPNEALPMLPGAPGIDVSPFPLRERCLPLDAYLYVRGADGEPDSSALAGRPLSTGFRWVLPPCASPLLSDCRAFLTRDSKMGPFIFSFGRSDF